MATNGNVAIGDIIEAETAAGSGVFFQFAEVTELPPPSPTVGSQEATSMESDGGWREFVPDLIDPGAQTFAVNYVNGGPTEVYAYAWIGARELRTVRVTAKNGKKYTYKAFCTGFTPTGSVGQLRTATVELKLSGRITIS